MRRGPAVVLTVQKRSFASASPGVHADRVTSFPENEPVIPPGPPWWVWVFAVLFTALGALALLTGSFEGAPWYLSGWQKIIFGALWAAQGLWMRRRSLRAQLRIARRQSGT